MSRQCDDDYKTFGRQKPSFIRVDELRYHYLRHYPGDKSNRGGILDPEKFVDTNTLYFIVNLRIISKEIQFFQIITSNVCVYVCV